MNIYSHPLYGVKARRAMLGVSLKDAAKAIGVQPNSFGRYERGERVICLPKAKTLARLLQCSVDDLEHEPSVDELLARKNAQHEAEVRDLLDRSNTDTTAAVAPSPGPGRPSKPLTEQQMIRKAIDEAQSSTVVLPAADPEAEDALTRRLRELGFDEDTIIDYD